MLHGQISHDRFNRLLSAGTIDSKKVWQQPKPLVQELCESRDCVVAGVDDTIQEKPYSQENELICCHYDHTKGKTVKGIHFLSAMLTTDELDTPIGMEFVRKPVQVDDMARCPSG